ncbi:MAG: hypothetical protein WAU52_04560 [Burkholderiales bacterium]
MTEKTEREIDRFFGDELLPLAARLKGKGVSFLETRLGSGAPTYFSRRPKVAMAKADFEWGGFASAQTVTADLEKLGSGGDASLATLAPGVARLARMLRASEQESSDVSRFVYVMY